MMIRRLLCRLLRIQSPSRLDVRVMQAAAPQMLCDMRQAFEKARSSMDDDE